MSKNIRIVSPAKSISSDLIMQASDFLTEAGHVVSVGQNAEGEYNYFSGTTTERLADFQEAIDDKKIDVILCARGGYGCIQIVDDLDFSSLKKFPKLILGFSDVTVFHLHCHSLGIKTAHTTMPLNFPENSKESLTSLTNIIEGKTNSYNITPHTLNVQGEANAEIIGGNLAIIQTLVGTDSDCDFNNKILFIEDVSEYVYTIDRMLWSLHKSGKLKGLKALIVGGMTDTKDTEVPFGKTVEQVILGHVADYGYPVCFSFPSGHVDDNRAIVFGKKSVLKVNRDIVSLEN